MDWRSDLSFAIYSEKEDSRLSLSELRVLAGLRVSPRKLDTTRSLASLPLSVATLGERHIVPPPIERFTVPSMLPLSVTIPPLRPVPSIAPSLLREAPPIPSFSSAFHKPSYASTSKSVLSHSSSSAWGYSAESYDQMQGFSNLPYPPPAPIPAATAVPLHEPVSAEHVSNLELLRRFCSVPLPRSCLPDAFFPNITHPSVSYTMSTTPVRFTLPPSSPVHDPIVSPIPPPLFSPALSEENKAKRKQSSAKQHKAKRCRQ